MFFFSFLFFCCARLVLHLDFWQLPSSPARPLLQGPRSMGTRACRPYRRQLVVPAEGLLAGHGEAGFGAGREFAG